MDTSDASRTRLPPMLSSASASGWLTLVYYFVVLVGLVVLYGGGDVATTGFIYQAF